MSEENVKSTIPAHPLVSIGASAERHEILCVQHARHWNNDGVCPVCRADELQSQVGQLRQALYKYGVHVGYCPPLGPCKCGLDELRSGALPEPPEPREKERCICAAIKLPDGRVFNGHRHDGAIEYAGKTLNWELTKQVTFDTDFTKALLQSQEIRDTVRDRIAKSVQGFTTSTGRFVDRYVGLQLQIDASVPSRSTPSGEYPPGARELFSEDLY